MHESCHLDRALNFEIGVEYQMIFVVLFFNILVKFIHDCCISLQNMLSSNSFFFFETAENKKKVNKYSKSDSDFNIQ